MPQRRRTPLRLLVVLTLAACECQGSSSSDAGLDAASDATLVDAAGDATAQPPVATITSGAESGLVGAHTTFHYVANDSSAEFECGLDGAFASCAASGTTFDFVLADDGSTHVFAVRAHAGGQTGPSVDRTFTVDSSGPSADVSSPTNGAITGTTGSIAIVLGDDAVAYTCRIDTFETQCTSSTAPFTLDDGEHTFSVQGFDALNNPGPLGSVTWTVDGAPPRVVSLGATDLGGGSTRISFQLSDASTIAVVRCRLDGGSFVDCGSGTSGTYDYPVGTGHLVEVYGIDDLGQGGLSASSTPPPSPFAWIAF